MTELALRPYQLEDAEAVEAAWARGMKRPAVLWATGLGKTVMFTYLAREFRRRTGRRVLVVAHRNELIEQAAAKLRAVAPDLSVGVVKAERNQSRASLVVGSVQTLRSEIRRRQIDDVGLVIVDECHHAAADSYLRILQHYGAMPGEHHWRDSDAVALGVTATMIRGDKLALGDVWQDVVASRDVAWGIREGFLVRPIGRRVHVVDLDLSAVRAARSDTQRDEAMGAAIGDSMAPEAIAKAYVEFAPERQGFLFAPTVASAGLMADALNGAGIATELVHARTPTEQRRRVVERAGEGSVRVLANVGVFTEGTDIPAISCAVLARANGHAGMHAQQVGRVLRPYPGKSSALVLDIAGSSERHSLSTPISMFGEDDAQTEEDLLRETEPCVCDVSLDDYCRCRKNGCTALCVCGGGTACGCAWESLSDELGLGDEELYRDGPIDSVEVDLFHGSASAWLRTDGGIWFLVAGERYIAIQRGIEAGTYDVVAMHQVMPGTGRWVAQGVGDLGYAMAYGEAAVMPYERMMTAKERGWRARPATARQRKQARAFGVVLHNGMTMGEVAAAVSVAHASQRIDPLVPAHARLR